MRSEHAAILVAVACAITLGCATKSAEPQAPPPSGGKSTPARTRLSELDALEHDLDVAERRLETQIDRKLAALPDEEAEQPRADSALEGEAEEGGVPESPTPAKPQTSPAPRGAPAEPRWDFAERGTPCDAACRALGSMKRSADRICELLGAENDRCSAAKSRVERAQERVTRAGCVCRER